MTKFIVNGGKPLKGEVKVSGSKNATLPILCASMLTDDEVILKNVPNIADVHTMIEILKGFGAKISFSENTVKIDASKAKKHKTPSGMVEKMRASILVLGAFLPRFGELKIGFPGGCVLGKRSTDAHTYGLKKLGCKIIDDKKGLHIKCDKIRGAKIVLPELSVTATENAIMMAVLAEGETEIRLAATEPHVQDLCNFLKKMGAKISGVGTNNLKIKGIKKLKGVTYSVTGDYLEAGTFAIAAVVTKGDVVVKGIKTSQLDSVWQKMEEAGVDFKLSDNSVHIFPTKKLNSVRVLRTAVYPSFPTDLQAPFSVLLTMAQGVTKIFETLFEGRLNYLFELEQMGAHIEFLNPHQALIIGPTKLKALPISSHDIRAGAAMVIAALSAKGKTEISNISYIDRGYEDFDKKLRLLGADISRVN